MVSRMSVAAVVAIVCLAFVIEDVHAAECVCPLSYIPECGDNGITYSNNCLRSCNNVTKSCDGHCPCVDPPPCQCTKILLPVCGSDGNMYDNGCLADCAGVKHKKPKIECTPWSTGSQ